MKSDLRLFFLEKLMGRITILTLVLILSSGVLAIVHTSSRSVAAFADGKALFLQQKCNLCHSVSTAGIEATTKSAFMRGPDLINLKIDAATMAKYLKKQTTINGKMHAKAVKLPDSELMTIINWLLAQRK